MAKKKTSKKSKRSPVVLIVVSLVVLGLIGGIGAFAYNYLNKSNKISAETLVNVTLKDNLIKFSGKTLPDIFQSLVQIDQEVVLIDKELERLDRIEKEFPNQLRIIATEKKIWNKQKTDLLKTLSTLEKNIETFYVSHSVNTKKGTELIEQKKEELVSSAKKALEDSQELTQRLRVEEKKILDKILDKFL